MYELSLTEHVMMSSDQIGPMLITVPSNQLTRTALMPASPPTFFEEDQLNFRRFPVFPGAVDTLQYDRSV